MTAGLIVAAGKGERLPGKRAKQYLPLAGLPILCHTLNVFAACDFIDDLVLVVPETDIEYCREVVLPRVTTDRTIFLAAGGARRQDSVLNGLQAVPGGDAGTVVVHDGVRPFVTATMIQACLNGLEAADGCIAAVPVNDTIKTVDDCSGITGTIDRASAWLAQTPQAFSYDTLLAAHLQALEQNWEVTDDAALLERLGKTVRVIPGSSLNIKITTPDDLLLAEGIGKVLGFTF